MVNKEAYNQLLDELKPRGVELVAVSKLKPVEDILALYELGQRDFGENYVQELFDKQARLPADIRWHFIGHLQSNKVKYIAPYVHLIHGVDSLKLLKTIDKEGGKAARVIPVLLQVHIAQEETKFGMNEAELAEAVEEWKQLSHVQVRGLMGMASFSEDPNKVAAEFARLKSLYDNYKEPYAFDTLSMGMSGDYQLAIEKGSNLVRIGSLLFGRRS
ncbi:MAG: YggS family pyridoxal phosphate-dependent enzyme [Flaviaesturariibacter sp.]|nr:YggS family pyridoxal phosphate-dependent enzyme [Flaviaesturariibacter sp.]